MKTLIVYGVSMVLSISFLMAQGDFSPVLEEIEKNNTTLEALRQRAEAGKLNSRTGIFLQNPEVGFNYLWGSPNAIGNRTDFNIMQSFDFPSAYKYKANIADLMAGQADLIYQNERINLMYEARLVCINLVYYNTLLNENRVRLENARSIAGAVGKMYEQGNVSILDYNKAQLNLANAVNDNVLLEAEANALRSELSRFNGGKEIKHDLSIYPPLVFPADFDEWYTGVEESNPILQYLSTQVAISENEEKLNRAMSLPKFSAGYMSEKIVGERYQGLSVGLSIPLWENKNTVKAARAQTAASLALVTDSRLQLYNMLKNHYTKAQGLLKAGEGYSGALLSVNSSELLKRAYDFGEISLIQYLVEVRFYYETLVKAMEVQRDMHIAFAELEKWN
jgi:outer membrane protein TolC